MQRDRGGGPLGIARLDRVYDRAVFRQDDVGAFRGVHDGVQPHAHLAVPKAFIKVAHKRIARAEHQGPMELPIAFDESQRIAAQRLLLTDQSLQFFRQAVVGQGRAPRAPFLDQASGLHGRHDFGLRDRGHEGAFLGQDL